LVKSATEKSVSMPFMDAGGVIGTLERIVEGAEELPPS
jgi:hypothetical protein